MDNEVLMPATQPQVKVGDILKVENVGSRIFRGMWDMVDYVIAPFQSDFMPFEAVKLFFGDPRATDKVRSVHDVRGIVGFLPDRPSEVRRLRLMYAHGSRRSAGHNGPSCRYHYLPGRRAEGRGTPAGPADPLADGPPGRRRHRGRHHLSGRGPRERV